LFGGGVGAASCPHPEGTQRRPHTPTTGEVWRGHPEGSRAPPDLPSSHLLLSMQRSISPPDLIVLLPLLWSVNNPLWHKEKEPLMNALSPPTAGRREWIGLAVLMLPTLLIVMDLTVLHLAVPHLTADLKPSSAQLLWIVDIYGFLVAGSLITMG